MDVLTHGRELPPVAPVHLRGLNIPAGSLGPAQEPSNFSPVTSAEPDSDRGAAGLFDGGDHLRRVLVMSQTLQVDV